MQVSGQFVDLHNETIYPAIVQIEEGKIVAIEKSAAVDPGFILPGFIDAHIHIESSLLPPSEFARLAIVHGTIATVSDPHEIANVLGVAGVEYMLENARSVPLKFYFGAPPCVPATKFETAGAHLGPKEIRYLLEKKEIKYLSEVMNFPGVIHKESEIMEKIAIAKELGKRVDGHAPGLRGDDLRKYISAGIETDHECTELEEAREKRKLGMKILVREGSAACNFDALFPFLLEESAHCMFCSDDKHPDSLLLGHINLLVKRSVERGLDLMKALRCASVNPVRHYGLEMGLLQPRDPADFIRVENLRDFSVLETYIEGRCVARGGKPLFPRVQPSCMNQFLAKKIDRSSLAVKAKRGLLKVIEAIDGQLLTNQLEMTSKIVHDELVADTERDILKIVVVNRYDSRPPAIGFIKNFGLKKGALASSFAHDSHNIVAVGAADKDLEEAINAVIDQQGGLSLFDGKEVFCLPLPIAGLMSDREGTEVARAYGLLEAKAKELGSTLRAPFMTLSFMALLVIPRLKMSDRGLFDEKSFSLTELFS